MHTYLRLIGTFPIDGTPFQRIEHGIYDSGACQCYKDCDCSSRKGTFLGIREKFSHPLSTKWFDTLKSCEDSFRTKTN